MQEPKYQVGQEVEAIFNGYVEYKPATIVGVAYEYTVQFDFDGYHNHGTAQRTEDQVRLPRPSEDEAWEKATMLIGKRNYIRGTTNYINPFNAAFDRETRHQVYQILGSAGIKITDEVKQDVRRLIGIADSM